MIFGRRVRQRSAWNLVVQEREGGRVRLCVYLHACAEERAERERARASKSKSKRESEKEITRERERDKDKERDIWRTRKRLFKRDNSSPREHAFERVKVFAYQHTQLCSR